jgi:hypothetical protein
MKNKGSWVLLFAVCLLMLTGCGARVGDFTVISTKNFDLGANYVKTASNVEGSDVKHIIVIFPTGSPSIKAAVDDILNKNKGEVVLDAVIETYTWYIPYVYGQTSIKIKGDVYKKAKQADSLSVDQKLSNSNADLKEAEQIYKAEKIGNKIKIQPVAKSELTVDQLTGRIVVN